MRVACIVSTLPVSVEGVSCCRHVSMGRMETLTILVCCVQLALVVSCSHCCNQHHTWQDWHEDCLQLNHQRGEYTLDVHRSPVPRRGMRVEPEWLSVCD